MKFKDFVKIYKKGTEIIRITDNGYIVFEDNWITENNKFLFNQKFEKFEVLEHTEIEDIVLIGMHYKLQKFSYVKLDKPINIGDVLYTY